MAKKSLLFAMLSVMCLTACGNEPAVTPDDIPPIHSETAVTTIDPALTTVTRPFTSGTGGTAAAPLVTGYDLTTVSISGASGADTTTTSTALSLAGSTGSTVSSFTTMTTTSLTTVTLAPLQQTFGAIAGDWFIDGSPSKGRVTIAATGVFTAYDGKNKVTAVGQAKHEYVKNNLGVSEPKYNLYNKFGNNIVLSIADTGAASYSELVSVIDGKTTYYSPKGKGFQIPDEAGRKKLVQEAMDAVSTLELLASSAIKINTKAPLPSNELYSKVTEAPVKSAQEIRKLLDEKLSGTAKARYTGMISGDMPQYLDANGGLYALVVTRKRDFNWTKDSAVLGQSGDRMFTATAQYTDPNGAAQTANMTFQYENGGWKLTTLE